MTHDEPWDDLSEILPHRAPMVLIDRIVALRADHIESEVTIGQDSLFRRGDAVPAYVGVEYMAQTCAAFAGLEASARGEAARSGFLLAARNYRARVSEFPLGTTLSVRVTQVHREAGGLSLVEGKIYARDDATPLVEATLTVFEVADLQQHLRERDT